MIYLYVIKATRSSLLPSYTVWISSLLLKLCDFIVLTSTDMVGMLLLKAVWTEMRCIKKIKINKIHHAYCSHTRRHHPHPVPSYPNIQSFGSKCKSTEEEHENFWNNSTFMIFALDKECLHAHLTKKSSCPSDPPHWILLSSKVVRCIINRKLSYITTWYFLHLVVPESGDKSPTHATQSHHSCKPTTFLSDQAC